MIMNWVGGEMGGEKESSQSQSQSFLLSEDERRALRGSKFAPLPPSQTLTLSSRLAHPGGPVKTNKAAALAKFLERKLEQPDGLKSLNPDLLQLAVQNANESVKCGTGGPSTSGRIVRHVASFEDSSEGSRDDQEEHHEEIKEKERKRKKKKITRGSRDDQDEHEEATEQKKRKRKKKKTAKDARSPKSHKSDKKRKIKK